jgi:hypothetical protein
VTALIGDFNGKVCKANEAIEALEKATDYLLQNGRAVKLVKLTLRIEQA